MTSVSKVARLQAIGADESILFCKSLAWNGCLFCCACKSCCWCSRGSRFLGLTRSQSQLSVQHWSVGGPHNAVRRHAATRHTGCEALKKQQGGRGLATYEVALSQKRTHQLLRRFLWSRLEWMLGSDGTTCFQNRMSLSSGSALYWRKQSFPILQYFLRGLPCSVSQYRSRYANAHPKCAGLPPGHKRNPHCKALCPHEPLQ
jgi:hypothetical protein